MAQHVDLIPVQPRAVELLGSAILGGDPDRALADLRADAPREGKGGTPEDWQSLATDVDTLRRMREAAMAGRAYEHQIRRQEVWGDDLEISRAEPMVFEGPALAEIYGQLLGSTLGRLLGLTFPTWSLGSGYSLGLLLAKPISPFRPLPFSGARRLRARLNLLAETPAALLAPVAVAGFEAAFPRVCEAFGTGLYFPPSAVREVHAVLTRSRKPLVSLGVQATGRERDDIEKITTAVQEAFAWAAGHDFGLLEGDGLVEAHGYR